MFIKWSILPSGHSLLMEPGRLVGVPMLGEDTELRDLNMT